MSSAVPGPTLTLNKLYFYCVSGGPLKTFKRLAMDTPGTSVSVGHCYLNNANKGVYSWKSLVIFIVFKNSAVICNYHYTLALFGVFQVSNAEEN